MSQYRTRLEVVELDARIVPSGIQLPTPVHGGVPVIVHSAAAPVQPAAPSLSGSGSGTILVTPSLSGGPGFALRGSGTFGSLGLATISGSVRLPALGASTGTLRLASASGSVTLLISGDSSGHYAYRVTSATGTGVGVAGTGALTLTVSPATRTFTLKI
jgi:hypothetical protein